MREIKFRGKRLDNGEWVEGDLVHLGEGAIIITSSTLGHDLPDDCDHALEYHSDEFAAVDLRTVGQWTGLCDRKKTKVYEGDIIAGSNGSINGYPWPFTLQIEWDAAACSFNTPKWLCMNRTHYYDVVGNVYDNPEKLK